MARKFVNTPGMKPLGMCTQVTAGQVEVVGAGDIQAPAAQVFENLKLG